MDEKGIEKEKKTVVLQRGVEGIKCSAYGNSRKIGQALVLLI